MAQAVLIAAAIVITSRMVALWIAIIAVAALAVSAVVIYLSVSPR